MKTIFFGTEISKTDSDNLSVDRTADQFKFAKIEGVLCEHKLYGSKSYRTSICLTTEEL